MITTLALSIVLCGAITEPIPGGLPGGAGYAEGRFAELRGRFDEAIVAFTACVSEDGPLAPYAKLRRIVCLESKGQRGEAIARYEAYLEDEPDGPWKALAQMHLALALKEAQRHLDAAPVFKIALEPKPRLWWFDDYAWLEAENAIRHPAISAHGFKYFRDIVETTPYLVPRFEAAQMLAESPNLDDRLLAAFGMIRARKYSEGGRVLTNLAPKVVANPHLLFRWTELMGRMLVAQGDLTQGREMFADAATRATDNSWLPGALVFAVRSLIRNDRLADAGAICAELEGQFPHSAAVGEAWWRLGRGLSAAGRYEEAVESYERSAAANVPHGYMDNALLECAKLHWQLNQPSAATRHLTRLANELPDSSVRAEARFWHGMLTEENGAPNDALSHYHHALKAGIGEYYAHAAQQRLDGLLGKENASTHSVGPGNSASLVRTLDTSKATSEELVSAKATSDAMLRLHFFGWHGFDEGEWEALYLAEHAIGAGNPGAVYRGIGVGGVAYSAIQLANAHRWGRAGGERVPERLRISYPLAYWPLVVEVADEYGVDPYLLLSVARKESTYRPGLTSWAGATGMMQLMPSTANWLADVEGSITKEMTTELKRPRNSLMLGAAYLRRMLRMFDGNVAYAVAAYNGGPGNVKKWQGQFGDVRLDEFIERIPYDETRNYVKGVLGNYAAYYSLYPAPDAFAHIDFTG